MIFNEAYNREKFSEFLRDFLPEDFIEREQDLSHIDSCKVITQAKELGVSSSLGVHVLEMSHGKETDPRVAIATDAFRILATYQIDKALVVFNSQNSENYRFSLLTVSLDINEKNKLVKTYSNARRFSFYLGPGAKARTPEHQLISKGRVKDVSDLIDRFSLEVVNKQFYLELAKHFDALVDKEKRLLSLPSQSDSNARKSFAMRLIGRIMFCWFLKQKHSPTDGPLIPDELLSSKAVQDGYYHNVLEPLFFGILNTPLEGRDIRGELYDSVPYLNGGLFNPQHDDYYDLDREILVSKHINTLVISDKWFRDFFSLLETYNFTIDENTVFDQELSVDPEMLGRIFENLLAEINPETGSSERKRTGSYYTPRQIVEYMVDRSLIEHLKTKTGISEEKLEALVSYDLSDDSKNPLELSERKSVIDAIDSLRLLDPACGSGAFPIGALQKIVWILQRVDADCELWLEKKLAKVPELYRQKIRKDATTNPFDYTRKLDVIKNSIFGVDIQPIAVEIARLRCFLTLVVESEVNDSKPNRGVEPLPNLDFKFVCANTLIPAPDEGGSGDRLFTDDFEEKLSAAVDRYFSSFGASKSSAGNDIHRLIDSKVDEQLRRVQNLISHSDERYQAALAKTNKKSIDTQTRVLNLWASYKNLFENKPVGFFDPKYFFPGVKEGFDVVIANPPYVRADSPNFQEQRKAIVESGYYKTLYERWDLFIPFIERGLRILSNTGLLCYITSNSVLTSKFGYKVLDLIQNEFSVRFIDYFDDAWVFDAGVVPVVFGVSNRDGSENVRKQLHSHNFENVTKTEVFPIREFKEKGRVAFRLETNSFDFKVVTVSLGDICYISYGLRPNSDERYWRGEFSRKDIVSDMKDEVHPVSYLEGKNLDRYRISKILYLEWNTDRIPKKLVRPTFPELYDRPKLLKGTMTAGTYDNSGIVCNHSIVVFVRFIDLRGVENKSISSSIKKFNSRKRNDLEHISTDFDLKYVLGIINSKFAAHFLNGIRRHRMKNYFYPDDYRKLPIPKVSPKEQEGISLLVDQILSLTSQPDFGASQKAQQLDIEGQIDQQVYRLYGLSDEEIKAIEQQA